MQRILLGYDASAAAERALHKVIELATIFDATVVLTSIAPAHELVPRGARDHAVRGDPGPPHERRARDAVARLAEQGIAARAVLGLGHTPETLVELANATEADLVVVGMTSRVGLTRLLGNVSGDGAHEPHCDVLLVH